MIQRFIFNAREGLLIMRKLVVFLLVLCFSISSFAAASNNDYDADYYESEGNLVFKMRLGGIRSEAKQTNFPNSTSKNPVPIGNLIENGYGAEAATSVFFSNNIAAELSLGFNALLIQQDSLKNVAHNYDGDPSVINKKKYLYMIPITITGQCYIAPFGGIRPYFGAGGHGVYIFSKAKGFNVKNSYGSVLQLGVDFYAKDDTLVNLDIKQYFLNTKVDYKQSLVPTPISSKVKFNPLVITLGIGFRF